jgi:CRP-like cAMP-binding protein
MEAMAATSPALRAGSLFDLDAELAERVGPHEQAEARRPAIVPIAELAAGPWSPALLDEAAIRPFALMIVDGLVLRELLLVGSTASELLGPGDVIALGPSDDALLPTTAEWSVPEAARVAILDERLAPILRAWPSVGRVLLERAARREICLSTHRAIAQLPRVDQRLLAYFAHLAERWGHVAPSGVVMPIHLTHETLGRLIGARRPTVSLALKELATEGLLSRRDDGAWLLAYEALDRIGAESAIPAGWHPAEVRPLPVADDDAVPLPRPVAARLTAEDIAALHARVELLRSQHTARQVRSARLIEHSRDLRGARARARPS